MLPDPVDDGGILADQDDPADHHDQAELPHADVGSFRAAGVETIANNGETDHDAKVKEFTEALKQGIDTESDIVDDNLEPSEPKQDKETNV